MAQKQITVFMAMKHIASLFEVKKFEGLGVGDKHGKEFPKEKL